MRRLPVMISAVLLALSAGAVPATATASSQAVTAYPTAEFEVKYGNTYATGTVTFFARAVGAEAAYKSVDPYDCRFVEIQALNSRGHQINDESYGATPIVCEASTIWPVQAPADVPGGAASVRVVLKAFNKTTGVQKVLASQRVFP